MIGETLLPNKFTHSVSFLVFFQVSVSVWGDSRQVVAMLWISALVFGMLRACMRTVLAVMFEAQGVL